MDSTPLESHPHDAFLEELPQRLARALVGLPAERFQSLSLRAPALPGLPGLPSTGPAVWWGRPADHRHRVGAGVAWELEAQGDGRFSTLAQTHRELTSRWSAISLDGSATLRAAFVGFAFSPDFANGVLPNALLSVPRVVLERRGPTTLMHFNGSGDEDREKLLAAWTDTARSLLAAARPGLQAGDSPSRLLLRKMPAAADPHWTARVAHALAAIDALRLEKLVLTRRVDLELEKEPSLDRILDWLAARYPGGAVFAVRRPGMSLFGASPERLVGLDDGMVVADALAGSAPRASCESTDQQLGGTLLGDPKELSEHAVVVREILAALEPLCTALVASHSPSLLRLPNVQHLASHVHGRVRPEVGLFELLERMHPTPAVGGAPRAAALDWLRRHDEADRGWYTGGVGWVDDAGGDIWVALRCATVRGRKASLFAGAGIVAGSDPDQELRETGWKLQAMLEALALD